MSKKVSKRILALFTCVMTIMQSVVPTYALEQSDTSEPISEVANQVIIETSGNGKVTVQENGNDYEVQLNPLTLEVPNGTTINFTVTADEENEITDITNNDIRIPQFIEPTKQVQFDYVITEDSHIKAIFDGIPLNETTDESATDEEASKFEDDQNEVNKEKQPIEEKEPIEKEEQVDRNSKLLINEETFVSDRSLSVEEQQILKDYQNGMSMKEEYVQKRKEIVDKIHAWKYVDNNYFITTKFYEDYDTTNLLIGLGASILIAPGFRYSESASNTYSFDRSLSSPVVTYFEEGGHTSISNGIGTVWGPGGFWKVDGHVAFCGEAMYAPPRAGSALNSAVEVHDDRVRKVIYYAYGYPNNQVSNYFQNRDQALLATNEFLSTVASGTSLGGSSNGQRYHVAYEMLKGILNLPSPPSDFKVYKAKCPGTGTNFQGIVTENQTLYWGQNEPKGNLTIEKSSANPSITDNNDCYSLEGAEYGLYNSEVDANKDVNRVGTFTIKADGKANTIKDLKVKTYYLKESKAPKGYALDKQIYPVSVSSGKTTLKTFKDIPQSDPIGILLGKVDKVTNTNKPQGSASLEGAEFTIKYYDHEFKNDQESVDPATLGKKPIKTWVLRTDATGFAFLNKEFKVSGDDFYYNGNGNPTLPLGTLTIQETKAPEGYKLNEEVFIRKITTDGNSESVQTYNEPTVKEEVIKGQIKIAKKDKDTGKVIQVAGTVFDIYFNGNKVSSMTTDKTGYAISEKLPYGQYVVKESKAPEGYLVDVNQQAVADITAEKTYEGELQDKNVFGTVEIKKEDSVTGNTAQGEATLEGAVYGVYARENIMDPAKDGTILHKKDEEIGRITTDAQAQGKLENLYLGKYYLKEITPSHGYTLDETEYPFDLVYEGQDVSVVTKKQTVKERVIAQAFSIIKISSNETDNPALLEGVEFTVKAQKDIDKYGSWEKAPIAMNAQGKEASVLVTDKKGYAVSDELPFGTYIVRETKAPEDHYAVQDFKVVIDEDSREPQVWRVLDDKEFKGYVQIVKKDADTGKSVTLNNASFQIVKYKKDGSVDANLKKGHIKTDANGIVSVKNGLLWYNTFVTNADNRLSIVEQLGNYEGMPQEDKGTVTVPLMLPTGDYELMETNAPDGYLKGQTVRFSLKKGMVTGVDQDGDPLLSVVYKDPKPKGRIELTKQFEDPDYIMHGKVTFDLIVVKDIVDPADGKILYKANDVYGTYELNKDNNKIVIENLPMGVGESHFKLVEKTTYENYVLNTQEYPVDFVQTDMGIPTYTHEVTVENKLIKIRTQALNADTKNNQFNSAKQITVTDVVSYEGLLAGQEYTMHGVLMDKETGEPVKNADGTIVEGYKKFTPEAVNGTVDVKMTLDASQLGGKDFVVFESVLNTGVEGHETCEIARHHDLTDKNQTITILDSKIGTTAKSENGSHEQQVKDGKVTFIDTVAYENLVAGMSYKVSGVLMDKTTGKALLVDGKEVTSETTFTPEEANGTVDVTFEFDASAITSDTALVVFERLVEVHTDKEGVVEEIDVAQHEDIDDEGQTIHFIDIKTTAQSDNGTNEQQPVDKEITFTDTVHYEGLQVGKEYTVTGKLMNKETNLPLIIDGKEVTSETTFTPEEANGTVDVVFTLNAKDLVVGQDIVVFEDLIRDEIKIASHADINDKDQTIHIIDVKTKASSEKDNHVGLAGKKVTITDTVSYTNLEVGKEYTVKGVLMNKETNEPLLDADGNQITGETTFTPEEANGTVDVIFTLDSSLLAGKEVVVFEDLYKEDIKVGSHADINDKDQTIKFKNYEIKVNKVDSLTKKNIISNKFEFTMFSDKECEEEVLTVAGNTEDGTAVFEVKEGTWYIKETKAPQGYKLSKEVVKVEVKDDKLYVNDKEVETDENYLYSIVYQNALLPSLQTGSQNHGGMYFMMMCFSALAFSVFFMIRKSYLQ